MLVLSMRYEGFIIGLLQMTYFRHIACCDLLLSLIDNVLIAACIRRDRLNFCNLRYDLCYASDFLSA